MRFAHSKVAQAKLHNVLSGFSRAGFMMLSGLSGAICECTGNISRYVGDNSGLGIPSEGKDMAYPH